MFIPKLKENIIAHLVTVQQRFTKCNNARCNSIFLVYPEEIAGDLGYLCPKCSSKLLSHHVIQCASCATVINMVRASDHEEKAVFTIDKCSHCIGSIEDEWAIEPIYQADSYF